MSTWVLLRGLTREAAHWGDFPARLAAETGDRVICCDLPGAGTLHRRPCPPQVEAFVEPCRVQALQQGAEPPLRLVGLSLGGMVATQWARMHAPEVGACVLVNASARPLSPPWQRLRPRHWWPLLRLLASSDDEAIERTVLQMTSASPRRHAKAVLPAWAAVRRTRRVRRASALSQLLAAARYRLPPAAPAVPALVVSSRGDDLVDPRCSAALAAWWAADHAVHQDAGHDLPLDDADWLCKVIAAWVRRPGAA